jgi:hypothetical protein
VTNLPNKSEGGANLPARRLSNRDFEMVIKRAAELQARESEEGLAGEGITEAEAMRIGRELGLSTQNLHRALAETTSAAPPETGVFVSLFGPGSVQAGRAVRGEPQEIARTLERYLVEREFLAVLRRFPDRVVFTRASGMAAAMGRATSQIFSRSPLLKIDNLEMAIQPFEEGYSYVSLATSLKSNRTATAASSIVGGGTGAAVTGAVLGIAIAPPAALLALPVLAISIFGGRAYYDKLVDNVHVQLESLLDRLEHNELPPPARGWSGPPPRLGRGKELPNG